jgi:hypothetical protein
LDQKSVINTNPFEPVQNFGVMTLLTNTASVEGQSATGRGTFWSERARDLFAGTNAAAAAAVDSTAAATEFATGTPDEDFVATAVDTSGLKISNYHWYNQPGKTYNMYIKG